MEHYYVGDVLTTVGIKIGLWQRGVLVYVKSNSKVSRSVFVVQLTLSKAGLRSFLHHFPLAVFVIGYDCSGGMLPVKRFRLIRIQVNVVLAD